MTITLRCSQCDQSMAIAPRKPGSRVLCPSCGSEVRVPGPEHPGDSREHAAGAVPAQSDWSPPARNSAANERGRLTRQTADPIPAGNNLQPPTIPTLPKSASRHLEKRPEHVSEVQSARRSGREPAEPPILPAQQMGSDRGLLIPHSILVLALLFAIAALLLAFAAGYLLGRLA